ncbi:MAG TPA: hypothetical protein VFX22_06575 [Candidatus Kapabacteria bacterium]|nr:hypothetical protein [Candidatus Kapabacteria bacterium]
MKAVWRAARSEVDNPQECTFKASAIDLNGDSLNDYVVVGGSYCSGADNAWFWIVINNSGHYHAQMVGGTTCLDVLTSKTNGFQNIRTWWGAGMHTATELWHYSNGKYRMFRRWHRTLH